MESANLVAQFYNRPGGLKRLVESFGLKAQKSRKVQMSNWQSVPLTPSQIFYGVGRVLLGCRVQGAGFGCRVLGARVWGWWSRSSVQGASCRVQIKLFGVQRHRCMLQGVN